jgi:gentisate 1,2-dioxygenase
MEDNVADAKHHEHGVYQQHVEDATMLRSREARPGEPELTGDRWWPQETWRVVDLSNEGALLTSYERWLAEREAKRREHRARMSSVIKREWLKFEPTRAPGVFVGYIVAPHLDQETPTHTVEVLHLAPGARTIPSRQSEAVYHVLSGSGYSSIYEEQTNWALHDSFHVPEGAWHQHVNDGPNPATLIVGRTTPFVEHVYAMARVYKGDSFSDLPDDYKPEHPFTKERVPVDYVGGTKWMSHMQHSVNESRSALVEKSRKARKILKAEEAVIERSEHKGDWKVTLVDTYLGFENRILGMYIHQLPPNCYTETHKHGQATIYVLTGRGYSIVDGERHDWQMGDLINVPAGCWHQHFNVDPERVSQHLLISSQPLRQRVLLNRGEVEEKGGVLSEEGFRDHRPPTEWWK